MSYFSQWKPQINNKHMNFVTRKLFWILKNIKNCLLQFGQGAFKIWDLLIVRKSSDWILSKPNNFKILGFFSTVRVATIEILLLTLIMNVMSLIYFVLVKFELYICNQQRVLNNIPTNGNDYQTVFSHLKICRLGL